MKKKSEKSFRKDKIIGERVYLRELKVSDADRRYCSWLNDEEVNRYLVIKSATVAEIKRYIATKIASPNCFFVGIFDKASGRHIGNIKLEPIDWERRRAEYSIVIGEKNYWGKGIGAEATRLIIDYAFGQLGLARICLGVAPQNKTAIELYKKLGFKAAKIPGRISGDVIDEITMLLRKEKK